MLIEDNCRICLKKETQLLKTATIVNNASYAEELRFCVPEIDWTCNDTPSLICNDCIKQLETAARFRRLCLESDTVRKKYVEWLRKPRLEKEQVYLNNEIQPNCKTNSSDTEGNDDSLSEVDLKYDTETGPKQQSRELYNQYVEWLRKPRLEKEQVYLNNEIQPNCKTNSSDTEGNDDSLSEVDLKYDTETGPEQQSRELYIPNRKDRTCALCHCTFSKYATLVNHVRSVHTFEKCFKCDVCGDGFTNSEILSRHKNRHTGERKYVCSYCGKKFFTNSDLNHHVQRHLNKRSYKCNICENKSFNTANSLRSHKLVVHTNPNEWKYLCTTCGRKCVTQAALTIHMKRHSNEKDFACHLCPKKFCTRAELIKHIASHSNMRLHKCDICGQEYKDRKVMERHLTKKHGIGNAKIVERIKKYICTTCPKKFVGKRQLEKHLRAHTGERPFKCELCEQTFICGSYIKGHMRSKHSMEALAD